MRILLTVNDQKLSVELNDSATATTLGKVLPLDLQMSRVGSQIVASFGGYLELQAEEETRDEFHIGEVAYWPIGGTLIFMFAGRDDEIDSKLTTNGLCIPLGKLTNVKKANKVLDSLRGYVKAALTSAEVASEATS